MSKESFILSIVKKIESLKEDTVAYGYKTDKWWEISVSDFNLYMNDERFKRLSNAWHKAAKAKGFKLIFVCGWVPSEQKLLELAESDNLILNI